MSGYMQKLMTVITEAAVENHIIQDIERLGAQGWTICDVRGKGRRGVRNSTWDGSRNVRIEIVCDAATAEAIAVHLQERYYNDYAMTLFVTDVTVLRPDKF